MSLVLAEKWNQGVSISEVSSCTQLMVQYYSALPSLKCLGHDTIGPSTRSVQRKCKPHNREYPATSPARPARQPKLPHALRIHPRKTLPQTSLLHLIVVR